MFVRPQIRYSATSQLLVLQYLENTLAVYVAIAMGCDSDMRVSLASSVHCCCIPGCIKARDRRDAKQLKPINVFKTRTLLACSAEVLPRLLLQLLK